MLAFPFVNTPTSCAVVPRHSGLVAMDFGYWSEGCGIESQLPWWRFDGGGAMSKPMHCMMSGHVNEPQVVEIPGAVHYGIFCNHVVVLGYKEP